MDIVLMTSDYYLSANVLLNHLLKNPLISKHGVKIKGIIVASPYEINQKSIDRMQKFAKTSGWNFTVKSMLIQLWSQVKIKIGQYLIPNKHRRFFDIEELAKQHSIEIFKTTHINHQESKEIIKKWNPDYLISCRLLQIVDNDVLSIPKKGSINAHPALTQKHRGTFTAFWSLVNRWKKSGVTIHFMTNEVDKGKIITQGQFRIRKTDTVQCLNLKSAKMSAKLIVKSLIKLKKREQVGYRAKKMGRYFKMPNQQMVQNFYLKGKSLMKADDLFVF